MSGINFGIHCDTEANEARVDDNLLVDQETFQEDYVSFGGHIQTEKGTPLPTVALTNNGDDWNPGTTVAIDAASSDTCGVINVTGQTRLAPASLELTYATVYPAGSTPTVTGTGKGTDQQDDTWFIDPANSDNTKFRLTYPIGRVAVVTNPIFNYFVIDPQ
jgi:hypothetical protein